MKKIILTLFVFAVSMGFSWNAYAASAATFLGTSVTVAPSCTVSATSISFPRWDGSTAVQGTGTIRVTCAAGTPFKVSIDAGGNYLAGSGNRSLAIAGYQGAIPTNLVAPYVLRMTSHTGPNWGDSDFANSFPSGTSFSGTGTGSLQTFTVYGTILANPSFTGQPGAYTDSPRVQVHY